MLQTVTILSSVPGAPLDAFTATWRSTSQIATTGHWTLQMNGLGLDAWLQDTAFLEWPGDDIPDGVSISANIAAVQVYQFEPTPPGTVLWAVQPVGGAVQGEGVSIPATRAQLESGAVAFVLGYDGGVSTYPEGQLSAITVSLVDVATGKALYSSMGTMPTLLNALSCQMVGWPEGMAATFTSGTASMVVKGSRLAYTYQADPEIGTYQGPPPGTLWWQNETGESSLMKQWVDTATPGEVSTSYSLQGSTAVETVLTISIRS